MCIRDRYRRHEITIQNFKQTNESLKNPMNKSFIDSLERINQHYQSKKGIGSKLARKTEVFASRVYHSFMGASMQGGIGGHAGLFGNAEDVAKVMYLFLNKWSYIDYEIFTSKSFELFNKRHFKKNRRGIGFDKPQLDDEVLSTCGCVSDQSFGHSGFTGTYAWVDPEQDLIFVFLSNRTYPSMSNNLLGEKNVRTRMQALVYKALIHSNFKN